MTQKPILDTQRLLVAPITDTAVGTRRLAPKRALQEKNYEISIRR